MDDENKEEVKSKYVNQNYDLLFKEKNFYIPKNSLAKRIQDLTSNISDEVRDAILEELQRDSFVDEIRENSGVTSLQTTFGEIKFSEIGTFFPDLKVEKALKDKSKRKGDCHFQSILYSRVLNERFGIENDVVTANVYPLANQNKYLHSWNEFEKNGEKFVLDYTWNAVMNQEGYYGLNHINKIISRISCVEVAKDMTGNVAKQMEALGITLKTYVTCRNEIMRDLEKNRDIFEEER